MVASRVRLVLCGKAILIRDSLHLLPGYGFRQAPRGAAQRSNVWITRNSHPHDPFLVDDKCDLVMGFDAKIRANFSRNGHLSLAGNGGNNFFHPGSSSQLAFRCKEIIPFLLTSV